MGYCKKHKQKHQTPHCPICLGEELGKDATHTGFHEELERAFKRLREKENDNKE